MKKPKKIKIYVADGRAFCTFQELKTYVYFHTCLEQKKMGYELDEDVITKRYIFTRQKGGLICEKTYDKDVEEIKKWEKKQLKLFKHEDYR